MQLMKKFFKIYKPFALNEIKQNFAYQGSFYLFILSRVLSVFINYYLWMAIYQNAQGGVLGGFTQSEMVTYVFISYITASITSISIAGDIGDDVVEGAIAVNLIKPIDYRTSILSRAFGVMVYRFVVPSLFIWIGLELYRVFGLGLSVTSPDKMILFLISCFLSFFIYVLFDFCFGMMAFFTTYIFGMVIMKYAILSFLTGQLIPLSFFPEIAQKIFDYLPFSSMIYTPVMIYLGKYSGNELVFVMLRQVVWVLLLYVISGAIWKVVTKRLVVLGG